MPHKRYHTVVALSLVVISTVIFGSAGAQQTGVSSIHPTPPPIAVAAPREGVIVIDGTLDESAWKTATPITSFRQFQPNEGAPASLRTEVRILYDDEAVYVGARMYDTLGTLGIRAPLARRDQLLDSNGNNGAFNSLTTDKLVVVLDPYHNHIDQVLFEVNPAGVKGDQFDGDPSWDPVWEAATHADSLGWTAELRIPYSQLRFSRDSLQTWGLQLWRYTDRFNERDMWSFWHRSDAGGPAFFGHLTGIAITDRPRRLELLPYTELRTQVKRPLTGDPYHGTTDTHTSVGVDAKYLLTSNLTLDATINPDFGQVEVDPATINLTAYETYYDEKRPFFVAGSSAFDFGGANCMFCSNIMNGLDAFYSRRIGRPPQLNGYVDNLALYDDTPDRTTIIGAAKVTGRTNSGYTVGLIDAVTNSETARYLTAPNTAARTQEVEPLSNYFVGRVKKELNHGATTIGGIFTSTTRRLDDPVLADSLHSHAEVLGIDWDHRWHQRAYSWIGSIAASNVAGSPSAIVLTERSSAHYFQRPDRRATSGGLFDTRYDTTATSLRGYALYTRLAKDNGNWIWETAQNWRSPGFESNDLAYLDRADYMWMNANFGRQWTTPGRWYRDIYAIAGGQQKFNYDGDRTDLELQTFVQINFLNYWRFRGFVIHVPASLDDRLTRGGPVVKSVGYNVGNVEISTDARRRAVFDLSLADVKGFDSPMHQVTFKPGIALKPVASVFISMSPTYATREDVAQYVTTVPDPTARAFYGNRYVFSAIHQTTLSLDTRVNWTFTPNLSLQLYVQPYIASGDYSAFREFAAPRTTRKLVYGTDIGTITRTPMGDGNPAIYTVDPDGPGAAAPFTFADPDFTYRSLIGNAVLRWEYSPGSTVYFVWTQNRTGFENTGDFDFNRERVGLFRDRPTNAFEIKVNYWIGR